MERMDFVDSPPAVLVLNEDVNLRISIAQILKGAGYMVSIACSPCEAFKQLTFNTFDLLFLDVGLMAGAEMSLIADIKRQYPCLPLLVLTPYLNSGEIYEDHPDPMIHFLVKPVDPSKILETIRSIKNGVNRPS